MAAAAAYQELYADEEGLIPVTFQVLTNLTKLSLLLPRTHTLSFAFSSSVGRSFI
jgi:hypothetical protein